MIIIIQAMHEVRGGTWPSTWTPEWMCGSDLHHSTVGIIGLGRIGETVAKRLSGFDCKVLFHARTSLPRLFHPLMYC